MSYMQQFKFLEVGFETIKGLTKAKSYMFRHYCHLQIWSKSMDLSLEPLCVDCKVEDGEGLKTYSLKSATDVTCINVR
jgi:hypothetical protein